MPLPLCQRLCGTASVTAGMCNRPVPPSFQTLTYTSPTGSTTPTTTPHPCPLLQPCTCPHPYPHSLLLQGFFEKYQVCSRGPPSFHTP